MNSFFTVVLIGALGLFIFIQVRGIIRDRKKRKALNKKSKKNLEAAEQERGETFEQDDHS